MKKILHKIAHLLSLNYGICDAFYKEDKLMMGFTCSTCGLKEGIHEVDEIINRELKARNCKKCLNDVGDYCDKCL